MDHQPDRRPVHDGNEHTPPSVSCDNVSVQTSNKKRKTETNTAVGTRSETTAFNETLATTTGGEEEKSSAEAQLVQSLGLGSEASAALSAYLTNLRSEITNLRSETANLGSEITNLESRVETLEGRLDHVTGAFKPVKEYEFPLGDGRFRRCPLIS